MNFERISPPTVGDYVSAADEYNDPDPSVTIIDASGDAILRAKLGGREMHFTIDSRAFARVCEPWKSMVKYRSTLGPVKNAEVMEFSVEDDDFYALEVVLHIAHMNFDKVPTSLEIEQLFALSILTDKYQATRVVGPWVSEWLRKTRLQAIMGKNLKYLWVAWEYGQLNDFEMIVDDLILELTVVSGVVLYHGEPLPEEVPPGLIGYVLEVRNSIIGQLLDIVNPYLEKCSAPAGQPRFCLHKSAACDASIIGSLMLATQGMNLCAGQKPECITTSVSTLAPALGLIKIYVAGKERSVPGYCHNGCDFGRIIRRRAGEVLLSGISSTLLPAHLIHLEHQRKLLGLQG